MENLAALREGILPVCFTFCVSDDERKGKGRAFQGKGHSVSGKGGDKPVAVAQHGPPARACTAVTETAYRAEAAFIGDGCLQSFREEAKPAGSQSCQAPVNRRRPGPAGQVPEKAADIDRTVFNPRQAGIAVVTKVQFQVGPCFQAAPMGLETVEPSFYRTASAGQQHPFDNRSLVA